ncbi:MAG: hypothetical protein FGM57_01875 [Candidatus Taylorbacteria bacterium]|nr:hypothetical protein [Candidatus Taylorbacteria bacterium]
MNPHNNKNIDNAELGKNADRLLWHILGMCFGKYAKHLPTPCSATDTNLDAETAARSLLLFLTVRVTILVSGLSGLAVFGSAMAIDYSKHEDWAIGLGIIGVAFMAYAAILTFYHWNEKMWDNLLLTNRQKALGYRWLKVRWLLRLAQLDVCVIHPFIRGGAIVYQDLEAASGWELHSFEEEIWKSIRIRLYELGFLLVVSESKGMWPHWIVMRTLYRWQFKAVYRLYIHGDYSSGNDVRHFLTLREG